MPPRRNRQSRRWYDWICLMIHVDSSDSSESETQASNPEDDHLSPPLEMPNPVTEDPTPYASHSDTEYDGRFLPPPPPPPPPLTVDTTHNAFHSNTEIDWRVPPPPPLPLMRNDDSVQPLSESGTGILEVESEHYRYRYETPSAEAVIDVIRSMKITEACTREKTQCPICQKEFALGEEASKLPCDHFFCFECIRRWLNKNNTCPVCRRQSPQIPPPHPHSVWEYFFWSSPHVLTESLVVHEHELPPSPSVPSTEAGYDTARDELTEAGYDTARDELDESHAHPQVPAFRASTSSTTSLIS